MDERNAEEPQHASAEPPQPASEASTDRAAQPVDAEGPPRLPFPVVGIGASAGGLEAISEFIKTVRPDCGMAFVVIQHLPPDRESLLAEVLALHTSMPVQQVTDGLAVEPNHVYVIRPGHVLTIGDGHLHLGPQLGTPRAANRPVDDFFKSLAEEQRERAICIIMSGMGSNGTAGCQAIKAVGGLCIAQDPDTAQFPSMPRHLIDAGYADYILRPQDIADVLRAYAGHPYAKGRGAGDAAVKRDERFLREILALLRTRTRRDFSGYKKATVLRRVQRRMGLNRVVKMGEYISHLRQTPSEMAALADDLLIHVTGFFRDAEAWEVLRQNTIVPLVASREREESVRCWVTACSSGEEAYTLAMLLVEESERVGKYLDIKVFATDMAERSLAHARAGTYPGGIEAEMPASRLDRFFQKDDEVYRVRQDLRERVIFAPQNVLQDPPFSRIDIATCRNLLIYLEPDVQRRVMSLLHFGLREGGTLFLGTSETVGDAEDLFEVVDKRARIYRRVGPTRHGALDFPLPRALASDGGNGGAAPTPTTRFDLRSSRNEPRGLPRPSLAQLTQRTLIEHHTPAAVLVDRDHRILYFHGNTRPFLEQPAGEPTRDLMLLARDGVRGAARIALHRAAAEQKPITILDGWIGFEDGHRGRIAVSASPLADKGAPDYFVVSFEERPEAALMPGANGDGASDGRHADGGNPDDPSAELQRARDELQSTIEELQTSNEELKASNEETMSMNEELQSANEELETSKEEMQSLNEELTTVNAQLQAKMEQHQAARNDLASLLTSTDIGVVFLDAQLRIRRFTPAVRDLMEVIGSDVGRPLSDLAKKFTDPGLNADAERVLAKLMPIEREVPADGERWFLRRITPYRTADNRIDGVVVTFVDVTERVRAEAALRASEAQYRSIFERMGDAHCVLDRDFVIRSVNAAAERLLKKSRSELVGRSHWEAFPGSVDAPVGQVFRRVVAEGIEQHLTHHYTGEGYDLHLELDAYPTDEGGVAMFWRDVTERVRAEAALRESNARFRSVTDLVPGLLWSSRADGYTDLYNRRWTEYTGQTLEQARGWGWTEVIHPDDREGSVRRYREAAESCRPLVQEHRIRRHDGAYRWFLVRAEPVRDEAGGVTMYGSATDIHDQRTMIATARESEERQAFLLKLSDALRPLGEPAAIQGAAMRLLGETLGVNRAYYAEIDEAAGIWRIEREYSLGVSASFCGVHRIDDFGWVVPPLRRGETLVIEDAPASPLIPEPDRAAMAAIQVGAKINVPLVKDDALVGALTVTQNEPRRWRPAEVALVRETAERVWAAVERARAEAAQRASEERLRQALAAARMGTWTIDLASGVQQRDANLNLLLGLEPVETTQPFDEFLGRVHADDRQRVRATFEASAAERRPLNLEFRILRPDGSVGWLRDQGNVFGGAGADAGYMTGACVDVTERREAEGALRESEERLRLIVEGARDFAMFMTDAAGRIATWNVGAERVLGYTEAEAVGQDGGIIFTPEDRAARQDVAERETAARDGRAEDQRWHLRKGGERFWGSGVMHALREVDGSVRGYVKVLRDETARKRAEDALREAKEAAEAASRMKDEFLATLSHELRTPLSAILLWSKLLEGAHLNSEQLAEGLAAITLSAEAQKELIDDLLDTSRITSGKLRLQLREVDPAALVAEAVEAIQPTADARDVSVVTQIERGSVGGTVLADPDRLRQVLWNLLTNAVKFTPSQGKVVVTLVQRANGVSMTVADSGQGIAPDFLPHVFERFRQADASSTRRFGGMGLGLAITKQLVELHGGTISVDSPGVGRGATFTIQLPLPPVRPKRAARPAAAVPRGGKQRAAQAEKLDGATILLVEDDAQTRNAVATTLRRTGAVVTAVESATDALAALEARRPDLLVSDIGLPNTDGFELMRQIRTREAAAKLPPVPAVALTAFVRPDDERKASDAGFDQHLGKPVDPDRLIAVLTKMMADD